MCVSGEDLVQCDSFCAAEVCAHNGLFYTLQPDPAAASGARISAYGAKTWDLRRVLPSPCACAELFADTAEHCLQAGVDKLMMSCQRDKCVYVSDVSAMHALPSPDPDAVVEMSRDHRWLLYTRLAMPYPRQVCQIDPDLSMLVMEPTQQAAACRLHVITSDGCHSIVQSADVERIATARWANGKLYVMTPAKNGSMTLQMLG